MQSTSKSKFGRLVNYVTDHQNKDHRVENVAITNCISADNVDWAVAEVESTQKMNTRSGADKTYHLLISFDREDKEKLTPDRLKAIEDFFCEQLGYAEHQRISAVHSDTDNPHIHVAINKVHPEKYNVHEPFYDYTILANACLQVEQKYGLKLGNHQSKKTPSQNRADDMERFSGIESFMSYLKNNCADIVRSATDWENLHKALAKHNVIIKERGAGLVFKDIKSGIMVKASSVSRDFSKQSLEGRLGDFIDVSVFKENKNWHSADSFSESLGDEVGYQERPIERDNLAEEVYKRYKLNEHINAHEKRQLINKAWLKRREKEMAVKAAAVRRRRIIKGTTKGLSKKWAYKMAHDKLLKDLKNVHLDLNAELNEINRRYARSQTWNDWLRSQAKIGDVEAIELLRRRQAEESKNSVRGSGKRQNYNVNPEVDSVTRQGTEIFKNNSLRDNGKSIEVTQKISDKEMLLAIQLAVQRYGQNLELKGDQEFMEQVMSVTQKNSLNVTFKNPLYEYAKQNNVSIAEAKAHKFADEQINKSRAKQTAESIDAVQTYINERQAKIRRGIKINEHKRFDSSAEGKFKFEGIRNIGGDRLGLFEKDNVIYVKKLEKQEFQRLKNKKLHETIVINKETVSRKI